MTFAVILSVTPPLPFCHLPFCLYPHHNSFLSFQPHQKQLSKSLPQLKWCHAWSPDAQTTFDTLKRVMTQTSVLSLPDFNIPFVLETNAFGMGMGVVLMQRGHPIAYFSKQFFPKLLCSSTYIRELHAITAAVKCWCHYLLGHSFVILTDHKSLRELMTQPIQTPEQHIYLTKLLRYDYTIQYKVEHNNVVVDAFLRIHEPSPEAFWILTVPHFQFFDDLKRELFQTEECTSLFNFVCNEP